MKRSNESTSTSFAAVVLAGLVISALLIVPPASDRNGAAVIAKGKKFEQRDSAAGGGEFDPQRDYDQERASDEERAYHGAIFVARVDSLERDEEQAVAKDVPPHRVLTYLVTVERSLAGEVSGQVSLVYFSAFEETYDNGGFGPLRTGERYLFFAGQDQAETEFNVQAGTGTIPITSDRQEAELVDTFRPLINEADAREQEVIARATVWAEARQARAGIAPEVSIEPGQGLSGTDITVRGANFGFMEATIAFGEDLAFADVSPGDGSFGVEVRIPKDAPAGPFTIRVDDQQGFSAELTFMVTG